MKTFPFIALGCLWMLVASAYTQTYNPPIGEVIKDWKTLRVSFVIDGSDYAPSAPFVLLQRLDAERIILSSSEESARSESLPVARAIITPDAARKLVDRIMEFYAQAQKETGEKARVSKLPEAERNAIYQKRWIGMDAFYIRIEILRREISYEYQDDFADGSPTIDNFIDFIRRAASTN